MDEGVRSFCRISRWSQNDRTTAQRRAVAACSTRYLRTGKYSYPCIPVRADKDYFFLIMPQATRGRANSLFSANPDESGAGAAVTPARTGNQKVRILVADDHDIIRRGLRQLLTAHPGWEVCGEAKTGREAVNITEQLKPDIVVLDISMPDLNGLEAARQITKISPKTAVLILTVHFTDQLVRDVIESGARGYILKSDADKDLVSAVEAISNRRTYFTREVSEVLLDKISRSDVVPDPNLAMRNRLTSREREIVQLLAEGKSSKEVAVALGISVKTAETHRANIMRKLELHSVSELVLYAIRNQIIEA
jgi:DNA-binding NarL/FixJ family response regulator